MASFHRGNREVHRLEMDPSVWSALAIPSPDCPAFDETRRSILIAATTVAVGVFNVMSRAEGARLREHVKESIRRFATSKTIILRTACEPGNTTTALMTPASDPEGREEIFSTPGVTPGSWFRNSPAPLVQKWGRM